MAGDVFQLGNASWRIRRVEPGIVRVADAQGAPPTIPFWLGEAPARTDELSASRLASCAPRRLTRLRSSRPRARAWPGSSTSAAPRRPGAISSLATSRALQPVGFVPTSETLVVERFFDEAGGMQLVIHAPFGGRINRAWGLALRKRFCRIFNFELQAAATDDAIVLSLGPRRPSTLARLSRLPQPATPSARCSCRRCSTRRSSRRAGAGTRRARSPSPRFRAARARAAAIQRMQADDLLAAVFPDAGGLSENRRLSDRDPRPSAGRRRCATA